MIERTIAMAAMAHSAPDRSAPGPRGHWLNGSVREAQRDSLNFYKQVFDQYGDVVRLRLIGSLHWHLLAHPPDVEYVLRSNHRNFPQRRV